MKVSYDPETDGAYLRMSSKRADGAVELAPGVILHTSKKNEIVAIGILDASRRFPIKTLYTLELDRAAG